MTGVLLLWSLFVTVCTSTVPSDIFLTSSSTCGDTKTVGKDAEYRLFGTGESPAADCSFTFEAASVASSNCTPALCYMFDLYAHFTNPKASLSIESGTRVMTYKGDSFDKHPYCTEHATLKAVMSQAAGYVFNKKKPEEAYQFRLSVYHKCGEKGSTKNMKFEDAVDHAKGYHQAEEKERRVKKQFVAGILLGFGLACIFLVVLFIAYCYTRNSPNRGPGRSVGMPKVGGFKKKMKPNQPSGPKEVEMGVRYQPQGERGAETQPESDPLLKTGASDPEKPPVDSAAITVAVDEVDEKKPEPVQVDKDLEKMEKAMENDDNNAEGDINGGGDTNTGADNSGDTHTGTDNSGVGGSSDGPGPTDD